MLKVILFDMDGTLVNSDQLVLHIYKKLTTKYQPLTPFESLDLGDVFASSYPDVLKKLYGHVNPDHLEEIYRIHLESKHHYLESFEGVEELLSTLKREGYRLGLVTSEMRDIAIDELKILNLDQYFDSIVAFDDVKNPKPDPEGILKHLAYFNCNRDEVIYIGDQKTDGIAAENASILSVLIDWHKNKTIDYMRLFDHVAYSIEDVIRIIHMYEKQELIISKDQPFKILQLTDLHLMNDEKDLLTYDLIRDIKEEAKPDFIVFTGDQTMSKDAVMLYQKLSLLMDELEVPYTFVFGNHDVEGNIIYQDLIDAMSHSKYFMFDQGPKHLGYSNHSILLKDKTRKIEGLLVFFDTHIDAIYDVDGEKKWGYGAISHDQIMWYERLIKRNPYPHLIFFHIPIPEVNEAKKDEYLYLGDYFENPCTPPFNTGFFDKALSTKQAKAMFFGHDHLNDFVYDKEGILLCYGRVSGHYDYAMPGFPKGARLITFNQGKVETKIILHQDIKKK